MTYTAGREVRAAGGDGSNITTTYLRTSNSDMWVLEDRLSMELGEDELQTDPLQDAVQVMGCTCQVA